MAQIRGRQPCARAHHQVCLGSPPGRGDLMVAVGELRCDGRWVW